MTQPHLRLRQIALAACALEPVERPLTSMRATEVCFRDPGVGKDGLHHPASLIAAATAIGASVGPSWFEIRGVRFALEPCATPHRARASNLG